MARILILTPQLPVPPEALTGTSQGTTIRNFNLLAGLSRRHTVDLVSFAAADDLPGASPQASEGVADLLRSYCRRIVVERMPTRTLGRRARDTLFNNMPDMALRLGSPAMSEKVDAILREHAQEYDVVQVEGIEMAPYVAALPPGASQLCRRAGRPLMLLDDHNAEYVLQRRAFLTDVRKPRRWLAAAYSLIQWRKLVRYERRICAMADRVVAVSEADRAALMALVPGLQVAVVPNGVDLVFYRPDATAPLPGMGSGALVFTGKMDYRPNVDAVLWFVEAVLPGICARVPEAHFYVVGQQPHARLAKLAGHPAVTVTGRVPDVRPYIAGSAVYVVPLRIGGGTRLKVLEAMAMGRPIVSTRLGCDGFSFAHGKEVEFADEPAAFAAAVVRLMHETDRARALGQAARSHVEAHFGWDAIVPRLEALYA